MTCCDLGEYIKQIFRTCPLHNHIDDYDGRFNAAIMCGNKYHTLFLDTAAQAGL
jgi:hypothetical protein